MSSSHDSDSRKRKRIDEVSAIAPNTPANSHPWDKDKFCDRIQQTTHELHQVISEVQKLYGSASVASLNVCRDTIADPCRRTSSLIQRKMYGRDAEKNSMLKLMAEGTSDGVLVVPILGIGGIGKTALAQSVYNDPTVKGQFVHRIWIWVSNNFDEVRLTMEMLDFVSQGMHAGISSLAKLQEILSSHVASNKTLLILDDVWDGINDCRWNKLLAPFRSDNMEGNVILVTTRIFSIAKRIGTVKPIELCGMQSDDFWLLFKKCSFGDETYQEQTSLNIIGQQIAEKLHHNPLAAETAGMLLRQHLTTDHWSNILKNEKWKSLQLNGGIMACVKLSYDNLPENLQQCFRYCCLFPKGKPLDGAELVRMWISQGYVHGNHTGKKLEDMGKAYLADLVNSGFFAKQDSNCFVVPYLMYDLARELSGADFATIDDKESKMILPTTRHLSIVTDSDYETFSDENLKKNLLQLRSVKRLRSLVIIGDYSPSFFTIFLNMFREVEDLRLLQICATVADFDCFINNLVSCTHVRYIHAHFSDSEDEDGVLPQALTNFFHLQVLDLGLYTYITLPSGMSNLVSMQHLVVAKEIQSTIACIGKMTALQELPAFKVRNASKFDIRQLQSMDQLVLLNIYQLKNVKSKKEAGQARLTDKVNLEELCLSWESWGWNSDSSNLGISTGTMSEVLEGLKPHQNVKHLQIIGYSGSVFPSWLSTELTSLQLLHLENCKELRVLPPVEKLPFLRKLKLINIYHVPEIVVPCLEELELNELPSLKKMHCHLWEGIGFLSTGTNH